MLFGRGRVLTYTQETLGAHSFPFGFLVICAGYRSSAKHCGQPLPKVCALHYLYENGAQFCSYLVSSFILGQGFGASMEIYQNSLFVIWQCSNFSCLGLLTLRCKSGEFHGTIFVWSGRMQLCLHLT